MKTIAKPEPLDSKTMILRNSRLLVKICPGDVHTTAQIIGRDSIENISDFQDCPSPLYGKTPWVAAIGNPPFTLLRRKIYDNGTSNYVPITEPGTGNPYGTNYDVTEMLCSMFRTKHFKLKLNNEYDHYDEKKQVYKGRALDISSGQYDFAIGLLNLPDSMMPMIDVLSYVYYIDVGLSSGHPKPIYSLFSMVKPFRWG